MTSTKTKELAFRIRHISEHSFYINIPYTKASEAINADNLSLSFDFDVNCNDIGSDLLTISTSAIYFLSEKKKKIKLLESGASMLFEIKNMNTFFNCLDDQSYEDKANILPVLLNLSISTMRGIIVTRTAGTPLAPFPMPVVDVRKIIQRKQRQK